MKKRRKSKSASRRARWTRFSREFREKSGSRCAVCGAEEGICVHHILQKRTHPSFWFEAANLICLCRSCHWKVHKGFEWEFVAWLAANRPAQFDWVMSQVRGVQAQTVLER